MIESPKGTILATFHFRHNLAIIALLPASRTTTYIHACISNVSDAKIDKIDNHPILNTNTNSSLSLWHQRLGHIGLNALEKLESSTTTNIAKKATHSELDNIYNCDICLQAKAAKKPNKRYIYEKATSYGEVLYSDIVGPITPRTYK